MHSAVLVVLYCVVRLKIVEHFVDGLPRRLDEVEHVGHGVALSYQVKVFDLEELALNEVILSGAQLVDQVRAERVHDEDDVVGRDDRSRAHVLERLVESGPGVVPDLEQLVRRHELNSLLH